MNPEEDAWITSKTSETSSVHNSSEPCEDTGTDPNPHLTEQLRELNEKYAGVRQMTFLDELEARPD